MAHARSSLWGCRAIQLLKARLPLKFCALPRHLPLVLLSCALSTQYWIANQVWESWHVLFGEPWGMEPRDLARLCPSKPDVCVFKDAFW